MRRRARCGGGAAARTQVERRRNQRTSTTTPSVGDVLSMTNTPLEVVAMKEAVPVIFTSPAFAIGSARNSSLRCVNDPGERWTVYLQN